MISIVAWRIAQLLVLPGEDDRIIRGGGTN